jgi:hypothetical protein
MEAVAMIRIVLPRSLAASLMLAGIALGLQVWLSYPAATCRSYPPIPFFWQSVAPYLALPLVFFFPLFDDRSKAAWIRMACYLPPAAHTCGWVAVHSVYGVPLRADWRTAIIWGAVGLALSAICYYLSERIAARAWRSMRQFSGEGKAGISAGFQFSMGAMLVGVTMIAILGGFVRWALWYRSPAELKYLVRLNLAFIDGGLQMYFKRHDSLPVHPDGPRKALYLLREVGEYVDAAAFDLLPDKPVAQRCRWDDARQELVGGDWEYINAKISDQSIPRVVLACSDPLGPRLCLVSFAWKAEDGVVYWNSRGTPREYLGTCVTHEGFLAADEKVYADWIRTHQFTDQSEWGTGFQPYSMLKSGRIVRSERTEDYPVSCTIETPEGTFDENYDIDKLGRLVRIRRIQRIGPNSLQAVLGGGRQDDSGETSPIGQGGTNDE